MQVANENLKLRELLAKQLRVKALEEKGKLQEELARMQQNEQKVNDKILLVEQERKVSQMHNMSIMSHLSVDPAALAQASMIQHNQNLTPIHNINQSQIESSFLAAAAGLTTPKQQAKPLAGNDDRMQIVQWHLSQIESAKEQMAETQRQNDRHQKEIESL